MQKAIIKFNNTVHIKFNILNITFIHIVEVTKYIITNKILPSNEIH